MLDLLAHGRDAAARLAAHGDGADAERAGLHADEARRLLREVDGEVRRGEEGLGAEVLHHAQDAVRARVGPDGDLRRAQVHGDLRHRQAADESPADAEPVHDEVPGPDAVGVEAAGAHLLPHELVAASEAHVGRAARRAGRGLDLGDALEGGGPMQAEPRLLLQALAQLPLLGEGQGGDVLEPADPGRLRSGGGELALVEHRVLGHVAELRLQLLELDAPDRLPGRALDVVEEARVPHARRSGPCRHPRRWRCR